MLATKARSAKKILSLHSRTEPELFWARNQENSRQKGELAFYTRRRNLLPQEYQERLFFTHFRGNPRFAGEDAVRESL